MSDRNDSQEVSKDHRGLNGHEKPYARLICPVHRIVYMSYEEYNKQLEAPGEKWRCPICRAESIFDDHWFDMVHGDQTSQHDFPD